MALRQYCLSEIQQESSPPIKAPHGHVTSGKKSVGDAERKKIPPLSDVIACMFSSSQRRLYRDTQWCGMTLDEGLRPETFDCMSSPQGCLTWCSFRS